MAARFSRGHQAAQCSIWKLRAELPHALNDRDAILKDSDSRDPRRSGVKACADALGRDAAEGKNGNLQARGYGAEKLEA